jgi:hypothetical protein
MLRFLDDHPNASLWLIVAGLGVVMLGVSALLRALFA